MNKKFVEKELKSKPKVKRNVSLNLKDKINKWHEGSIKYEYYYHPISKALKATLGLMKHGDSLLITFSIPSPKEKEVTKTKARLLINNRLENFVKYMKHTNIKDSHPPIFVIPNWKNLLENYKVTTFKDLFNFAVTNFLPSSNFFPDTNNITAKYTHFQEIFSQTLSKFEIRTQNCNK